MFCMDLKGSFKHSQKDVLKEAFRVSKLVFACLQFLWRFRDVSMRTPQHSKKKRFHRVPQ